METESRIISIMTMKAPIIIIAETLSLYTEYHCPTVRIATMITPTPSTLSVVSL